MDHCSSCKVYVTCKNARFHGLGSKDNLTNEIVLLDVENWPQGEY